MAVRLGPKLVLKIAFICFIVLLLSREVTLGEEGAVILLKAPILRTRRFFVVRTAPIEIFGMSTLPLHFLIWGTNALPRLRLILILVLGPGILEVPIENVVETVGSEGGGIITVLYSRMRSRTMTRGQWVWLFPMRFGPFGCGAAVLK
jgi:hypothetical protein